MRARTVVLDADSTLAAIEGIDWLAALRGAEVHAAVAHLTALAMAGETTLDAMYAERLARIAPTRAELARLADAYVRAVEPGAHRFVRAAHDAGVTVAIVSGGIRDALLPLAQHLGVPEPRVHAVRLAARGDDPEAVADRLEGYQPLATQRGKVDVVRTMLEAGAPRPLVMVGDGSTDAVVREVADAFVAYTGVVARPAVVAQADHVVAGFDALADWLALRTP